MQRPQGWRILVGRNRFIAPIGRAPPHTLVQAQAAAPSGSIKRRNKAIAPYDPHFASFNFTNAPICAVGSSACTGLRRLPAAPILQPTPEDYRP
jgi:hypothetical protein